MAIKMMWYKTTAFLIRIIHFLLTAILSIFYYKLAFLSDMGGQSFVLFSTLAEREDTREDMGMIPPHWFSLPGDQIRFFQVGLGV